jgi:hypothetical protein
MRDSRPVWLANVELIDASVLPRISSSPRIWSSFVGHPEPETEMRNRAGLSSITARVMRNPSRSPAKPRSIKWARSGVTLAIARPGCRRGVWVFKQIGSLMILNTLRSASNGMPYSSATFHASD